MDGILKELIKYSNKIRGTHNVEMTNIIVVDYGGYLNNSDIIYHKHGTKCYAIVSHEMFTQSLIYAIPEHLETHQNQLIYKGVNIVDIASLNSIIILDLVRTIKTEWV